MRTRNFETSTRFRRRIFKSEKNVCWSLCMCDYIAHGLGTTKKTGEVIVRRRNSIGITNHMYSDDWDSRVLRGVPVLIYADGSVETRTACVGERRPKQLRCDAKRLEGLFKKKKPDCACGEGNCRVSCSYLLPQPPLPPPYIYDSTPSTRRGISLQAEDFPGVPMGSPKDQCSLL